MNMNVNPSIPPSRPVTPDLTYSDVTQGNIHAGESENVKIGSGESLEVRGRRRTSQRGNSSERRRAPSRVGAWPRGGSWESSITTPSTMSEVNRTDVLSESMDANKKGEIHPSNWDKKKLSKAMTGKSKETQRKVENLLTEKSKKTQGKVNLLPSIPEGESDVESEVLNLMPRKHSPPPTPRSSPTPSPSPSFSSASSQPAPPAQQPAPAAQPAPSAANPVHPSSGQQPFPPGQRLIQRVEKEPPPPGVENEPPPPAKPVARSRVLREPPGRKPFTPPPVPPVAAQPVPLAAQPVPPAVAHQAPHPAPQAASAAQPAPPAAAQPADAGQSGQIHPASLPTVQPEDVQPAQVHPASLPAAPPAGAVQAPPAGAVQAPPAQQVPTPPKRAAVEALVKEASDGKAKKPSCDILKDIKGMLESEGFTVKKPPSKLDGKNSTDPTSSFEVVANRDHPGETFYNVKVTYNVEAEHKGPPAKKETISFTRILVTTATSPEDAIKLASNNKELMIKLAFDPSAIDPSFETAVKSGKPLLYDCARNAAGGITHLRSVRVSKDPDGKTFATQPFSPDSQTKWVYDYKTKKYSEKTDEALKPGQRLFDSEIDKDLHERGVSVENEYSYDQLETSNGLKQKGLDLQKEITEKQAEFDRIKKDLIKEPSWSLFGKKEETITPEFEHFKANAKAFHWLKNLKDQAVDPKILSDVSSGEIHKYAGLKDKIRELKKAGEDADTEITRLENLQRGIDKNKSNLRGATDPEHWSDGRKDSFWDRVSKYISRTDPSIAGKNIQDALPTILKAVQDKKQKITAELAAKNNELKTQEKEIESTLGTFNEQLEKMHKINRELDLKTNELKKLRDKAKEIVNDPAVIDKEKKGRAKELVDAVPDKFLEPFEGPEGTIVKQKRIIDTILNRLGEFSASTVKVEEI